MAKTRWPDDADKGEGAWGVARARARGNTINAHLLPLAQGPRTSAASSLQIIKPKWLRDNGSG